MSTMDMDEELRKRFVQQMLDELMNNNTKPMPTIICESECPNIVELIRKNCLFAKTMIPFRVKHNLIFVPERLDTTKGKIDFGMLYIFVDVN